VDGNVKLGHQIHLIDQTQLHGMTKTILTGVVQPQETTAAILIMNQTDLGVIQLIVIGDGNIAAFHSVMVSVYVVKEKN